jgi:hypothetical protein
VKASNVSAARHEYGHAGVAVADESPNVVSAVLPLLILCVALAAATIWFVALPAFDQPVAKPSCEVVVLKGAPRCLEGPTAGLRAVPKKPKASSRPKR